MNSVGQLSVTPVGDREAVMTRRFDAPRELVFACYTKPELVRRWLLGPPGWTMPVCEIDSGWAANTAMSGMVQTAAK